MTPLESSLGKPHHCPYPSQSRYVQIAGYERVNRQPNVGCWLSVFLEIPIIWPFLRRSPHREYEICSASICHGEGYKKQTAQEEEAAQFSDVATRYGALQAFGLGSQAIDIGVHSFTRCLCCEKRLLLTFRIFQLTKNLPLSTSCGPLGTLQVEDINSFE